MQAVLRFLLGDRSIRNDQYHYDQHGYEQAQSAAHPAPPFASARLYIRSAEKPKQASETPHHYNPCQ